MKETRRRDPFSSYFLPLAKNRAKVQLCGSIDCVVLLCCCAAAAERGL